MREFINRLLKRIPAPPNRLAALGLRRRAAAPAAVAPRRDDFSWMWPPDTLADPGPWDQYWRDQMTHGVANFVHMFCDDGELVDAMRANGLTTVLCVGNGISQEPKALARAGFDVTALDLSPYATDIARRAAPPEDFLAGLIGGRSAGENGHVEFVTGDLCEAALCPGPYHVVIDRRTLQLYPDDERPAAMRAVARRLASPGIFFSQSHDGAWRPPKRPRNPTERWFAAERWPVWRGETPLTRRVAWPFTTTG